MRLFVLLFFMLGFFWFPPQLPAEQNTKSEDTIPIRLCFPIESLQPKEKEIIPRLLDMTDLWSVEAKDQQKPSDAGIVLPAQGTDTGSTPPGAKALFADVAAVTGKQYFLRMDPTLFRSDFLDFQNDWSVSSRQGWDIAFLSHPAGKTAANNIEFYLFYSRQSPEEHSTGLISAMDKTVEEFFRLPGFLKMTMKDSTFLIVSDLALSSKARVNNSGCFGINYPDHPKAVAGAGFKAILFKNVISGFFTECLQPLGKKLWGTDTAINGDAFYFYVYWHHLAHFLGFPIRVEIDERAQEPGAVKVDQSGKQADRTGMGQKGGQGGRGKPDQKAKQARRSEKKQEAKQTGRIETDPEKKQTGDLENFEQAQQTDTLLLTSFPVIEECKADSLAFQAMLSWEKEESRTAIKLDSFYQAALTFLFRQAMVNPDTTPQQQAAAIIINHLLRNGAIKLASTPPKLAINRLNIARATRGLLNDLIAMEANGTEEGIRSFINLNSILSPAVTRFLQELGTIPATITLLFPKIGE